MSTRDIKNSLPLTLRPGESVVLHVEHAFAAQKGPNDEELINGFYVVNSEFGEVEKISGKEGAYVTYTQSEIGHNTIEFHSHNPSHSAVFNVIHVPIHDHADMSTGGPAFATYDSVTGKNETQEQ